MNAFFSFLISAYKIYKNYDRKRNSKEDIFKDLSGKLKNFGCSVIMALLWNFSFVFIILTLKSIEIFHQSPIDYTFLSSVWRRSIKYLRIALRRILASACCPLVSLVIDNCIRLTIYPYSLLPLSDFEPSS